MAEINYELLFTILREMIKDELSKTIVQSHNDIMIVFDKASLRTMVKYERQTKLTELANATDRNITDEYS